MIRYHSKTCLHTDLTVFALLLCFLIFKDISPIQQVEVYTGACTHDKVEYHHKQSKATLMSKGTAKVIINRNRRKFEFYLNDKLVLTYKGFTNIKDKKLNEETFNFDIDAQAIINYKAKELVLYTEMMYNGNQCQQYAITDFKSQLE